jgi:hypothetical protein
VLFSNYVLAKKDLSYKKRVRKTLMKSTPGLKASLLQLDFELFFQPSNLAQA